MILPSDPCWTVKLTSFEAFVSPTVTESAPLQVSVRLSLLVDVVTIFSPRTYCGCPLNFSLSVLGSLGFAVVEFSAVYLPRALLWSSEMVLSTAFLASKVSHSGLAVQPLRKIRKGKLQETVGRLRKYGIEIEHTLRGQKSSSNKLFEDALFHLWD